MIYIIQVISFLAAVVLAKHDAPAVNNFEDKGIEDKNMAVFHRYNTWIKGFICILCALVFHEQLPAWKDMAFSFVLSILWIWLAFDPVLNLARKRRDWHYLGKNDADGRRWISWFGEKNAGKWKAVILSGLIIVVNVLKLFL